MAKQREQAQERRILWLTDLHYKDPHNRSGSSTADSVTEDVFGPAVRFLTAMKHEKNLILVGVGGDLTTRGQVSGIQQFETDMLPALRGLRQNPGAICIVPGNHDVKWGVDPKEGMYYDIKFEAFKDLIQRHRGEVSTCMFPRKITTAGKESIDFENSLGEPIYVDKDAKLLVLNINSAVRCGELRRDLLALLQANLKSPISYPPPDSLPASEKLLYEDLIRDIAHVTPQQKAALDKALSAKKQELGPEWQDFFRIAIVHHHLAPYMKQHVDDRQFLHMVDSHFVLELLEQYDFHLALSGHTHQEYMYKYVFPSEKEVVLLGGLTLGGAAVTANGQGLRLISVVSNRYEHKIEAKSILLGGDYGGGRGDAQALIDTAPTSTLSLRIATKTILERESKALGHGCDELVSCTAITREGDALKSLEYRNYVVCPARRSRSVGSRDMDLPYTSGIIDENVRVQLLGDPVGQHLKVKEFKRGQQKLGLIFEPHLLPQRGIRYSVSWVSLNAYAMDHLQFQRKYGAKTKQKNEEFVYETPDLAVGRLTVVAQFPHGFRFEHPPRVSVVRRASNTDMREWQEEEETTQTLRGNLRFFHALNAYSLIVKAPQRGLSYRIVWTLAESEVNKDAHRVKRTLAFFNEAVNAVGSLNEELRNALEAALSTCVGVLRSTLLVDGLSGEPWRDKLDASLMIWDLSAKPKTLSLVAAIESGGKVGRDVGTPTNMDTFVPLSYSQFLDFGTGIAGRTLKMNRLEQWDRKQWEATKESEFKANFYEDSDNSPRHASLISIPVHCPVDEHLFNREGNIYRKAIPFGVINVGSSSDSLPGAWLGSVGSDTEGKLNSAIQRVQHLFNESIGSTLQKFGLHVS